MYIHGFYIGVFICGFSECENGELAAKKSAGSHKV